MSTTVPLSFDIYARDHASSTFNRFGHSVSGSTKSVSALRSGLGLLAKAFVGLYVVQKVTTFMIDSVAQARESNKVSAQTVAVLKSTKNAANLTADSIGNLANKLSLKAGVDDEEIQAGENLLLTFRNIRDEVGKGNDIFTRATKIGLDMSVAMGTDLKSANIQLGKALNDPVKGITALTRVGVSFTQQQQDQIAKLVKHNKTLDAQKIILRELNKEFKGSAKAQADPADRAKVAWENLQETIGLKVLPILDKLLVWFVAKGLPAVEKFGGFLSDKLGPIISQVASWFSDSSQKGGQLSTTFERLVAAGRQMYEALLPIAVQIVQMIQRNWPQIQATITQVMQTIATVISTVAQTIKVVWRVWGDTISMYVERTMKGILTAIQGVLHIIEGVFKVFSSLLKGDWKGAWDGVKEILRGALEVIKGALTAGFAGLVSVVKTKGAQIVAWFKTLPAKVMGALGSLREALQNIGIQIMMGLLSGIQSQIGAIRDTISSIAHDVIEGGLKGALGIFSPSKVTHGIGENVIQGLIDGISAKISALKSKMQEVASMVTGLFGNPLSGENVNTVADIFRQQRSETGSATRLRNDIKRLLHKGLDMKFITDLISTGNLGALHELAMAPAAQVRRFERGQERLERVERRTSGILNRHDRERVQDLRREREKDRKAFEDAVERGARKGVKDGMSGRSSHNLVRQGGG